MTEDPMTPFKAAQRLTKVLDDVFGKDRFEKEAVDLKSIVLDYSRAVSPEEPIEKIVGQDIKGCDGALVPSTREPRSWGILYNTKQNAGRINYTIGHELGHYLLHRDQIDDEGLYCDEESILRRNGEGIEKEADEFAANLLMPLNDYRRIAPPDKFIEFSVIEKAAKRYGVSLTAAALRWLEFTEMRAIMIVSNEGFVNWAKPSEPGLKTGIFLKTRNTMNEMPPSSLAQSGDFTDSNTLVADRQTPLWFGESCREICFKPANFDKQMTILQFEKSRDRVFVPNRKFSN